MIKKGTKQTKTATKKETNKDQSGMAELLEKYSVKIPQEGERIEGKVLKVDKEALYVDLGNLGTGIIYGREIKSGVNEQRKKIKKGDKITATVVDLENEDGYVELSIKEAIKEAVWSDLKKKKEDKAVLTGKVINVNKGGLMIELNGITGFMPVSQLTPEHYPRVEDGDKNKIFEILKSYVDNEMKVCIIDTDPEEEKLIFSEREAYKDEEKEAIAEFKKGDIIEGEVSGVVDFGAFVKFLPPSKKNSKDESDMLEGLVHISQLDWKLIDNPRDIVKVGDRIKAKIIDISDTRISLSIRDLKTDPWAEVEKKYKVGDVVEGTVNKINHFGAFVYLNKDIHGLAHISEFIQNYPNKNIDEIVKVGEKYKWEIMLLDPREHRMGLKLVGKKSAAKKSGIKKEAKTAGKTKKNKNEKSTAKKQTTPKEKISTSGKETAKKEAKKSLNSNKKIKKTKTTEKK